MDQVGIVESAERVLAGLYRDNAALQRLLTNARLDVDKFDFSGGDHLSVVNACLRLADRLGKLDAVIEAAKRDHEASDDLQGLADELELKRSPDSKIAIAVGELRGFSVLLRRSRHLSRNEFNKLDAELQKLLDMTAMSESDRRDADTPRDQWDDLNKNLRLCVGQLQVYRELMDASAKRKHVRVPGTPEERVPLTEVAAERTALVDGKMKLFDALIAAVRACQDAD